MASYAPSLINFRFQLLTEIRAAGHEVLCLAPDLDRETIDTLDAAGLQSDSIKLERTGLNPMADVETVRALIARFRAWSPDVVTGYTPKAAIYSALAGHQAGVSRRVPMITGLGYAFLKSWNPKIMAVRQATKLLYRRAFRASTGLIFQNKDDLATLQSLRLIPRSMPIALVGGSGVDVDRFAASPLPPVDNGLTFLLIARLVRYKGIFEFCEAARIVRSRGHKARFVLIGPSEGGPAGLPASELARYSDVVTYLGSKDDVRPFIRDAHVYVLPSYGEGMPRTVLEALAMGRPIITTDANGCRDTVEPGSNGLIVPVADARALADAMMRLIAEPDRLAAMATASRLKAEREFDVKIVNRATRTALGLGLGSDGEDLPIGPGPTLERL
ncbi:MAG: glycosyltransferase family 4 protein [Hyphomicrobiaceae bacterium]